MSDIYHCQDRILCSSDWQRHWDQPHPAAVCRPGEPELCLHHHPWDLHLYGLWWRFSHLLALSYWLWEFQRTYNLLAYRCLWIPNFLYQWRFWVRTLAYPWHRSKLICGDFHILCVLCVSFSHSTLIHTQEHRIWASLGNVPMGQWTHIAVVFNGTHVIGFQDGIKRAQSSGFSSANHAPGTGHVYVGKFSSGIYYFQLNWAGLNAVDPVLTYHWLPTSKLKLSGKPKDGWTGLLEQTPDCRGGFLCHGHWHQHPNYNWEPLHPNHSESLTW